MHARTHNRLGATEIVASGCVGAKRYTDRGHSHHPHGGSGGEKQEQRSLSRNTTRTFRKLRFKPEPHTHTLNSPAQRAQGGRRDALRSAQHTVTVGADV